MAIPSYIGKTFLVEDNDTRIRHDDLLTFAKYQAGEVIPVGKQVGDFKTVPRRTEVRVSKTKTDANRNVFVFIEALIASPEIPSGWTKAMNLEGRFLNELLGFAPGGWDAPPQGDNFTVTDTTALIRGGAPGFLSTGQHIAPGSYVLVTSRSGATVPRGKYVKAQQAFAANGQLTAGAEIGWTAASNLTEGCSQTFFTPVWKDQQGPNACWQKGAFIGARVMVDVVGVGGEAEQITLASLDPYLKLRDAAASKNLEPGVESAFRTYARQAQLYQLFLAGQGNLAAKPGASNHQHGQAFDLNTRGFNTPLYLWLTKNGPKLGFIRTVNKEHWHWEYRPAEAATLAAQGKFKLPGVKI